MKIEYQRETFQEVISEEFVSKKFDIFNFKEQLRAGVKTSQGIDRMFRNYLESSIRNVGKIINDVLKSSPFVPQSLDFKKLRISLMLNAVYSIKTKHKLDSDIQTIIL